MLDLELRLHRELRSLLDLERVVLEGVQCTGGCEIDSDGVTTGGVHGEGEDDAVAWVVGVGEVLAPATNAKGFFVALHCFVIGVWGC